MPGEDQVEPPRVAQVPDQQDPGGREERQCHAGCRPPGQRAGPGQLPGQDEQERDQQAAGGQAFGPGVEADPPPPRSMVADVIGQQGLGAGTGLSGVTAGDMAGIVLTPLSRPRVQASIGPPGRERVQGRLMRSLVEQARPGALLRPADRDGVAVDDLRDLRLRVVQVTDQDGLGRADGDARGLQPDVEAVRAQVAFLGRVVFGVDEDRVVGACGDAGLAADADRLVEVDDAVRPPVHRLGRAGGGAGRVRALVAPGHLERSADLREGPDLGRLDVGPGHPERDLVLALARRGARMAPDALVLVQDFCPALEQVAGRQAVLSHRR
jgi:hypothetical protein